MRTICPRPRAVFRLGCQLLMRMAVQQGNWLVYLTEERGCNDRRPVKVEPRAPKPSGCFCVGACPERRRRVPWECCLLKQLAHLRNSLPLPSSLPHAQFWTARPGTIGSRYLLRGLNLIAEG